MRTNQIDLYAFYLTDNYKYDIVLTNFFVLEAINMRVLNDLYPSRVFYYFEDICKIPHGSGDTDKISDYCVDFAKKHNLEYIKDAFNNVIIKKSASQGYQSHPPVIIQGHLDMVCQKDASSDIDFKNDGLDITHDGKSVFAKGTTLGGDDGIAIAMALAILEDDTLSHPPIEAVFTTDEETGMYGAVGIDTSALKSKILLNIDSEKEGILTVSCAGGARVEIDLPLSTQAINGKTYKITLGGLIGGHSGVEIDKGRLNSNIMLGKFLSSLDFEFNIVSISGGLKDNAIPVQSECVVVTNGNLLSQAHKFTKDNYVDTDPNLNINIEEINAVSAAFDKNSGKKIVGFVCVVPNGVINMSSDIDGLVQTSLNLGILKSTPTNLHASFAVRSSLSSEKEQLINTLKSIAHSFDGQFSSHGHYPAWEYKKNSRLRDTMISVYENLYGKKPVVEAIHAGLECGLFCDKIDGLDAVSFGPDIADIHTPREKLDIESTARTYNFLINVLKEL